MDATFTKGGCSSVGRAPALQAGGQEFESLHLHSTPVPISNTMVKTQTADGTLLETARESRWMPLLQKGGVAQLGEHLPCKQGVKSSNLSISIRRSREAEAQNVP